MKRTLSLLFVVFMLVGIMAVPLTASAASKLSLRSNSGTTVSADSNLKVSWSSVTSAEKY